MGESWEKGCGLQTKYNIVTENTGVYQISTRSDDKKWVKWPFVLWSSDEMHVWYNKMQIEGNIGWLTATYDYNYTYKSSF